MSTRENIRLIARAPLLLLCWNVYMNFIGATCFSGPFLVPTNHLLCNYDHSCFRLTPHTSHGIHSDPTSCE